MTRDRQQAVEGYGKDRRGRRTRLCEECGGSLVLHTDGPSCATDASHVGTVLKPTAREGAFLLSMERGTFDVSRLPVHSRPRYAYLIQERHNWGQHVLCRWFPVLLQGEADGLGCEAPRPASIELW